MSQKNNPKAIGAFVTIAFVLFVGLLLFFGSANVFSKETRYILFFDQSVNGLTVGSSVKLRGVPVGTVEQILIRTEGQNPSSNAIPVIVSIDQDRVDGVLGGMSVFDPLKIEEYLSRGLVGQLSVESYITGQIFVEFSFRSKEASKAISHSGEGSRLVEIPTVNTSFDQITNDVSKLIENFGSIDLGGLGDNLNRVLGSAANVLEGVDGKEFTRSLTEAIDAVTELLRSEALQETIISARLALEQVENTALILGETVESYDLETGPLAERLDEISDKLVTSFGNVDLFFKEATELVAADSDVRYEFESTLRELNQTVKSIRALVTYLERNPNALITGRAEE